MTRDRLEIVRFRLRVVAGPDIDQAFESNAADVNVGSGQDLDLHLTDPCVSRHHCVIRVGDDGLICEDLGSTNGTFVAGHRVSSMVLAPGDTITIGETEIAVELLDETISEELSPHDHFGHVFGRSSGMRRMFAVLERVASSDANILLEGETGTGKSVVAEAIHEMSRRSSQPFVVVDCGALPRNLLESELFGHERGAFTGATETRIGLFESAQGGTILLDEIGELPLDLQPKLLRTLERRVVRRVGSHKEMPIDVRVIAATHRDLRWAINQRTFRSDLWYRLNTVRVVVPPLRERREDIAMLAAMFYRHFTNDANAVPPAELVRTLMRQNWPGNVRELASAVERSLVGGSVVDTEATSSSQADLSYRMAKSRASSEWERQYLSELLPAHGGNVSRAARAAKMNRSHLSELVHRHGLTVLPTDE